MAFCTQTKRDEMSSRSEVCEDCPLDWTSKCPFDWDEFKGPAPSEKGCREAILKEYPKFKTLYQSYDDLAVAQQELISCMMNDPFDSRVLELSSKVQDIWKRIRASVE